MLPFGQITASGGPLSAAGALLWQPMLSDCRYSAPPQRNH